MTDRPAHPSSTKAEASSFDTGDRVRSRRYVTRSRLPIIDEIIDLNVSVTRFNQQVLSSVFGVLSDVLDRSNDASYSDSQMALDGNVRKADDEFERAKDRSMDAVGSGLAELSDKFDRAAATVRRKSNS